MLFVCSMSAIRVLEAVSKAKFFGFTFGNQPGIAVYSSVRVKASLSWTFHHYPMQGTDHSGWCICCARQAHWYKLYY